MGQPAEHLATAEQAGPDWGMPHRSAVERRAVEMDCLGRAILNLAGPDAQFVLFHVRSGGYDQYESDEMPRHADATLHLQTLRGRPVSSIPLDRAGPMTSGTPRQTGRMQV